MKKQASREGPRKLFGTGEPPGYRKALAATWDVAFDALTASPALAERDAG